MKLGASFALVMTALIAVASSARAHEVLHSIERGRAIAVKAYFADGDVLAYSEYQVFSPADSKIPYQKGRTDRSGYLAFVPDATGTWTVKVIDGSGHGLDLDVAVDTLGAASAHAVRPPTGMPASWAFVLRPVLGIAVIIGLFVVLRLVYRRRGTRP